MKEECVNEVATRIGEDWESLATFIGIPDQDVFDIKEKFPRSPRDQRLALGRRWRQIYGEKATYLMMLVGLERLQRRDIIDQVLDSYVVRLPSVFSSQGVINSTLQKSHGCSCSNDDNSCSSDGHRSDDQCTPANSNSYSSTLSEPLDQLSSGTSKLPHSLSSPAQSTDSVKSPKQSHNSSSSESGDLSTEQRHHSQPQSSWCSYCKLDLCKQSHGHSRILQGGSGSNSSKQLHDESSPCSTSESISPKQPPVLHPVSKRSSAGSSSVESSEQFEDVLSSSKSADSPKQSDGHSFRTDSHSSEPPPQGQSSQASNSGQFQSRRILAIFYDIVVQRLRRCVLIENLFKVIMYTSLVVFIVVSNRGGHAGSRTYVSVIPKLQKVDKLEQTCSHCLMDLMYRYHRQSDLPDVDDLFIGRARDVRGVVEALQNSSIIHVVGPPGFGKSRLAIEVGHHVFDAYLYNITRYANTFTHHSVSIDIDELVTWSHHLHTPAILVLDNCDQLLESDVRVRFLNMICALGLNSTNNLQIILTSSEKLVLPKCRLHQWEIQPIDESASVELLTKLSPSDTSEKDLTEIAALIEGSPLALRIVGGLLTLNGKKFAKILIDTLKSRPSDVFKADSINEFHTIMDFMQESLTKDGLGHCGGNISLFPSSFNWQTGTDIVSKDCVETFLQFSLLDQKYYFADARFAMHVLIRDYFSENVTLADRENFDKEFYAYYMKNFRKYMKRVFLTHDERYSLITIEAGNIAYFINLLKAKYASAKRFKAKDLAVLAFLQKENLTTFEEFEPVDKLFKLYSENTYAVCTKLDADTSGTLYAYYIVSKLLQMCECYGLEDYAKKFLRSPCTKIFLNCDFVRQVRRLENIWQRLRTSERNYILRAIFFHCGIRAVRDMDPTDVFWYMIIFFFIGLTSSNLNNYVFLNQTIQLFFRIIVAYLSTYTTIRQYDIEKLLQSQTDILKCCCLPLVRAVLFTALVTVSFKVLQYLLQQPLLLLRRFLDVITVSLIVFTAKLKFVPEVSICQYVPLCYQG